MNINNVYIIVNKINININILNLEYNVQNNVINNMENILKTNIVYNHVYKNMLILNPDMYVMINVYII